MISGTSPHLKTLLVPEATVEANGEGPALELGAMVGKRLLLILRVNDIIEQESLHISVWGSTDGKNWGQKALFLFPQAFYAGAIPAALDLKQRPEVKFMQARWDLNRWGRGYPLPHFVFSVEIQELNGQS